MSLVTCSRCGTRACSCFPLDAEFDAFRARNPDARRSAWLWQRQADRVTGGRPHATIGGRLSSGVPWDEAAEPALRLYRSRFELTPGARVTDLGCGSLRVGVQLIRYLDAGGYFGLEPNEDILRLGRELAGPLLQEKRARVEALSEDAVAEAASFGADLVISTAVAFHVDPESVGDYFATLRRLARRPGARAVFDGKIADRPTRYAVSGWAWPLDFYREHLAPLELVKPHLEKPYREHEGISAAHLEFRMPY